MKPRFGHRNGLSLGLALAVVQLACGLGGQPSSAVAQPTSGAAAQASQPSSGATSGHGSADEAKAMLQKAVDHYNSVGRDQALADFTGRAAPFFDRDLYLACIDSQHLSSANGGFPTLVGQSTDAIMDANGKPLGADTWDTASASDVKSVDYPWTDPETGKTEPKTLFYEKVGSDVCGVGVYKP